MKYIEQIKALIKKIRYGKIIIKIHEGKITNINHMIKNKVN